MVILVQPDIAVPPWLTVLLIVLVYALYVLNASASDNEIDIDD